MPYFPTKSPLASYEDIPISLRITSASVLRTPSYHPTHLLRGVQYCPPLPPPYRPTPSLRGVRYGDRVWCYAVCGTEIGYVLRGVRYSDMAWYYAVCGTEIGN
eukprot:619973-Rhodomonas_salina.1